jgi:hypothetical protein
LPKCPGSQALLKSRIWYKSGSEKIIWDPQHWLQGQLIKIGISHLENDIKPTTQLIGRQPHNLMKRILKKCCPRHGQLDVGGEGVGLAQVPELVQLPPEGALVLGGHAVGPLGPTARVPGTAARGAAAWPRILKGGGAGVVVHEVAHPVLRVSELIIKIIIIIIIIIL